MYECKHAATDAVLTLNLPAARVCRCNLLENEEEPLPVTDGRVPLSFRGFEVKTLRVSRA